MQKSMSCVHLLVKRLMNMNDIITMGKRTPCVPYEEEIKRLESIVQLVLSTRADDGIFVDDTGLTAFHLACTLGDKSMAEDFLRKGADVNKPVKSCSEFWPAWTPLHFAACFNIEMMVLLMQNGANVLMKNLKEETPLDLCAKRFNPADIHLILSTDNELKDVTLSDNTTKLLDLLLVIHDYNKFSDLLQKLKDVNVIIPFDSPIWPCYSLLHLCVSLNEKTIFLDDLEEKLDLPEESEEKLDVPEASNVVVERYNCTNDEEALYLKRIKLCLESGCSVSIKNANGQTPIHLAFNNVREVAVEQLLSHSKTNKVDANGFSHLHIACVLGNVGAVKRYVNRGADVNCRVNRSFDWHEKRYEKWNGTKTPKNARVNSTPLHLAVQFGHEDIVEYLLKHNANVYAQDSMGFTPIHLAMYAYPPVQDSLAKQLFEATPNLRDSVSTVGLSHLHVAAYVNDGKAVDKLLLNGAQVDRVIAADAKRIPFLEYYAGKTPLLTATFREKAAKSLLKAGANVYAKDLEGVSALQHELRDMSNASAVPFIRMVKRGKYEVESCGMTLLHVACANCDVDWAKRLIEEGADVNARINDRENYLTHGATPLHILLDQACLLGFSNTQEFVDMVELFLSNGADVTIKSKGSTPLHLIFENHNLDDSIMRLDGRVFQSRVVDLLLKSLKTYDVNPVNFQGFSHFHLACVRDDVETARQFLDHGVDVNAAMDPSVLDSLGFSPLHFAMAHRSRDVAYLLLKRGADVNAKDMFDNTPLHLALKRKFVDLPLIEVMISRGADVHAKNEDGETLLYILWRYGGLTEERLKFFWNHGCFINILDSINAFSQSKYHEYDSE